MQYARLSPTLPLALAAAASIGCSAQLRVGPQSLAGSNAPARQVADAAQDGATSPQSGSTGGGGYSYSPNCPTPNDHCLTAEDVIASARAYEKGYIWAVAAVQQNQADSDGTATFMSRKDGKELVTKNYWITRPAQVDELAVGQLVAHFEGHRKDRIYYPPQNSEKAHGDDWLVSRIVSIDSIGQGFVYTANGHQVHVTNIRLVEGDESPTAVVAGPEDEHFLHDNHYIVSERPLPAKSYTWAKLGVAVREPSAQTRGEGHYILTKDGNILWTANGWKTRKATEADLQVGAHVFYFEGSRKNKVYQAPPDRLKVLSDDWLIGKITDNSQLYKGVVTVAGKHAVAVDNVRVAVQ